MLWKRRKEDAETKKKTTYQKISFGYCSFGCNSGFYKADDSFDSLYECCRVRAALISAGINLPGGGQANPADAGASSAEDVSSGPTADSPSSKPETSGKTSSQNTLSTISVPSEIVVSAPAVAAANRGKILRQTYNGGYAGDLIQLARVESAIVPQLQQQQ